MLREEEWADDLGAEGTLDRCRVERRYRSVGVVGGDGHDVVQFR